MSKCIVIYIVFNVRIFSEIVLFAYCSALFLRPNAESPIQTRLNINENNENLCAMYTEPIRYVLFVYCVMRLNHHCLNKRAECLRRLLLQIATHFKQKL